VKEKEEKKRTKSKKKWVLYEDGDTFVFDTFVWMCGTVTDFESDDTTTTELLFVPGRTGLC